MSAASSQVIRATPARDPLAFMRIPWVDRIVGIAAIVPFAWLAYSSLKRFGLDVPRIVLSISLLVFMSAMVIRRSPQRVTANPWFWILTVVESYWGVVAFAWLNRGRPIAPDWISTSVGILGALLQLWARISLGRNIGLLPALRSPVTEGPYRYMRHPIYTSLCLGYVAVGLRSYSLRNAVLVTLGIFWFCLKSVAEGHYLRSDAGYSAYMQRVRWRWLPGIA
jgi:protein-S-isoprenylcysteine O-methyltransferase Ste14